MIAKTPSTNIKPVKLKVGDRVRFQVGPKRVRAVILEDRGRIGVNGRRLFRVQHTVKIGNPIVYEMPEQELSLP